jgi:hypothetical protein
MNSEEHIVVKGVCCVTKEPYSISVPRAEYEAWKGGQLAQTAFRSLSATEREFFVSGISPRGWEMVFSDDGEDENEGA